MGASLKIAQEEIRRCAHALWQQAVDPLRPAEEFWCAAEKELRAAAQIRKFGLRSSLAIWLALILAVIIFGGEAPNGGESAQYSTPKSVDPEKITLTHFSQRPSGSLPTIPASAITPIPKSSSAGALPLNPVPNSKKVEQSVREISWDRKEAIKFGFDAISSRLEKALVAAAALFWFALPLLTKEKRISDAVGRRDAWNWLLVCNTMLAASSSILFGFLGLLYLTQLPLASEFSINGDLRVVAQAQLLFFVAAAVLFLAGLFRASDQPNSSNHSPKPQAPA